MRVFRSASKLRRSHADPTHEVRRRSPIARPDSRAQTPAPTRPTPPPPPVTARGAHAPTLTHACTEQMRVLTMHCVSACLRAKSLSVEGGSSSLAAVENSERARALVRRGDGGGGTSASAASRAYSRASEAAGAGSNVRTAAAASTAAPYCPAVRRCSPWFCAAQHRRRPLRQKVDSVASPATAAADSAVADRWIATATAG